MPRVREGDLMAVMPARPRLDRWRARGASTSSRRQPRLGWFYLPAALYFALFMVVPIVAVLALAFTRWAGFNVTQVEWIGLGNFRQLFHDGIFGDALLRTLIFVVVTVIGLSAIGLSVALVLNSRVRGHALLQVAMMVPLAVSPVISGVMWSVLLGPLGLANAVAHDIGFGQTVNFLGPSLGFPSILIVALWQYAGYDVLLYYAALQSLPLERVEAAQVDGAHYLAIVRYVIWPYLRPVAGMVVIINLIGGWKVFDIVYVLTGGGPADSTQVLSTWLYQQAFGLNNLGYASTIGLVIVALAAISLVVIRRFLRPNA